VVEIELARFTGSRTLSILYSGSVWTILKAERVCGGRDTIKVKTCIYKQNPAYVASSSS